MDVVLGARRIAVLKANALGDFIQTLPALDALRAAYPDAEITLLARDWHAAMLNDRPGPVDDVYSIPHGALGDELVTLDADARERTITDVRARRFDICLQMHGGGRNSNPLVRTFDARLTAGPATPDAPRLDRTLFYDVYQPDVLRNLEIAALVGAVQVTLEPRLAVTDADVAESLAVLPADDRPLVVIHPGASDERRRWPAERFGAVGDALARMNARVVVTGTDAEKLTVERTVAAAACTPVDLCGRLSLNGLIGLLSHADLVVSNDTGPRHLAAAVGTPTVGIYWIGNLLTAGPLSRGRHRAVTSWNLECPECGRNCITDRCDHRPSFVADIPTDAVVETSLELYSQSLAERALGQAWSSA